jgi:hypothetical protein
MLYDKEAAVVVSHWDGDTKAVGEKRVEVQSVELMRYPS